MKETVEKLYKEWLSLQPLNENDQIRLNQKFMLEFNYNSNHIEGNPLTYGQTELLLMFGKVVDEANMKDLEEMKAHNVGLKPIVCVGETLEQRENGLTEKIITEQTKLALEGLTEEQVQNTIIAYEPIWAIGTGKTATSDQAQEVCAAIRECIKEMYDEATAEAVRIQYGGSVNAKNAAELFAKPDIDGGLVGGASLKAEFGKIVNY